MLKADAYGLGLLPVARALKRAGCRHFAVAAADEAARFRAAGFDDPLLMLMTPLETHALAECVRLKAAFSVGSREELASVRQAAVHARTRAAIHLKIDTGMGRFGFFPHEAIELLRKPDSLENEHLHLEGLYTHFSAADEPREADYTRLQFARFNEVERAARAAGFRDLIYHCGASAALLRYPEMACGGVRVGIALHGLSPSEEYPLPPGMELSFALKTNVLSVRTLEAGSSIGYGRKTVAHAGQRVAVLPVGYSDGISRALSGKIHALIRGQRAPFVGNICMNAAMVDVSQIEGVVRGDEAVLIGEQGNARIAPEEWARALGTVVHEIPTMISYRVPRVEVTKMANERNGEKKRKSLEELFEGYEGDYKPEEEDWGPPVGREVF